jgi:hypothetical protein
LGRGGCTFRTKENEKPEVCLALVYCEIRCSFRFILVYILVDCVSQTVFHGTLVFGEKSSLECEKVIRTGGKIGFWRNIF